MKLLNEEQLKSVAGGAKRPPGPPVQNAPKKTWNRELQNEFLDVFLRR